MEKSLPSLNEHAADLQWTHGSVHCFCRKCLGQLYMDSSIASAGRDADSVTGAKLRVR